MLIRRPLSHWFLLLALVATWGSSFLLVKLAVSTIPPATVAASRIAIAAIVSIIVLATMGKRLPKWGRPWRFFIAIAVLGNCVPFYLISWGQQTIDSGLAGILMAITPLTTLVLAHYFVHGERLTGVKTAGFIIGFLGIVVLMGPVTLLEIRGHGTALLSELAVLGGAFCFGLNAIVARRSPEQNEIVLTVAVLSVASLIMVPAALTFDTPWTVKLTYSSVGAVIILGVLSTAVAAVLYFKLISLAGPTFLSLINYLIPIWAVAMGVVFANEQPEWRAIGALALILVGIAVSELKWRTKAMT